jgi:2-amino-4-hydroxy-6-hydroxymethyldihydropteridine diphosphokinase
MSTQKLTILSLGSNLGDRHQHLKDAVLALREEPGITLFGYSHIYETAPVGNVEQDSFLNACVAILSDLEPLELLHTTQRLEINLGRDRSENAIHWGPRTIDIDLISMQGVKVETPELTLPHAEAANRAFVLVPMADMMGEDFPFQGVPLKERLIGLLEQGAEELVRLTDYWWDEAL